MILVDRRGWILLQERDEFPAIDPEKWGLVGGHVDDGEDVEAAAYRELLEETGVRLPPGTLRPWRAIEVFHAAYGTNDRMHVYAAPTSLTDADIVCGEGRQIVFVAPAAARALDLTASASIVVPGFLDSPALRQHDRVTTPQESQHSITVVPVPGPGAEDVVVATHGPDEGSVFTGTEDGAIWRISPDGAKVDRVAETAGRPLGLEIDLDGRLLVCDAHRGLLRVDTRSGGVEAVADSVDGVRMVFCNNAAIASDGTVWFSDSSTKYGIENWRPTSSRTPGPAGCSGATPTAPSPRSSTGSPSPTASRSPKDESYVAVAESAARTVVRHWLTGPKAGTRDYLVAGPARLPRQHRPRLRRADLGHHRQPDRHAGGAAAGRPDVVRKSVTRIPDRLQPKPKRTVRVQALDDSGTVVHDVDVTTDDYHMVTGVREHDGRVWLGSLHEPAIAVVDL